MKQPAENLADGLRLLQTGKLAEAEAAYNEALRADPDNAEAFAMLGAIKLNQGNLDEALHLIGRSIAINPSQPLAHNNQGVALQQRQRFKEALDSFDRAVSLGADFEEIYYNRAVSLQALKRYDEALADYDRAIARRATYPHAWNNRGNTLRALKRYEDAIASYDRAITLKPDFADAHNNRGNALHSLHRCTDALPSYDQAIKLKPDFAAAYYNRGVALEELGRNADALADYERAIALKPDYADALWSKSTMLLRTGDFKNGWPLYEWRWKRSDYLAPRRDFKQPTWMGDVDLTGKTIFIYAEQGLGDTIQFSRYIKLLASKGAKVILEVQAPLKSLMTSVEGAAQTLAQGEPLPDFDYHCALLSLPAAFKTGLAAIPSETPYLKLPEDHLNYWKAKLGERRMPRIGFVWGGNPKHRNDHNRSMQVSELTHLFTTDAEFFNLQKEISDKDRAFLSSTSHIKNIGVEFKDFADAAAAVSQMDLVITVDTAIAHLAGTLGKPVWLLLPYASEWRWLENRYDSPWYPTMRLFRQQQSGDWGSVISAAKKELSGFIAKQ